MSIEIVKKITFKSIAGVPTAMQIKEAIKSDREILDNCMHVIGYAVGEKVTVNPDNGESYSALSGDFLAFDPTNPDAKFQSAVLYLPPIAQELIMAQLRGGNTSVEFALRVGTRLPREGEKSPTGYIYTVAPLIEPSKSSPLLALLERATGENGYVEKT